MTSKSWISVLVSVVLIIFLIALLLVLVDWREVLDELRRTRRGFLVAASACLLLGYLAYAVRWRLLMNNRPGFMLTFHSCNAAHIVNGVMPLRPGDPARILILATKEGLSIGQTTSSLLVERWFEQLMRLAALGGAFMIGTKKMISPITLMGAAMFFLFSWIFMIWLVRKKERVIHRLQLWLGHIPRLNVSRVQHGVSNLIEGFAGLVSLHHLTLTLAWSICAWGFFWGFHYLCLLSLNPPLDMTDCLVLSLGSLSIAPPSAISMPVTYYASIVIPFELVGFESDFLAAYAVVLNTVELFWLGWLGIWGIWRTGVDFWRQRGTK